MPTRQPGSSDRRRDRLGARDRFGHGQVLRRRDLDVRLLAVDEPDRMAGALGQRRLVGRVLPLLGQRQRVAQHATPERLRRLRQVDPLARQCLAARNAIRQIAVLDRVARRDRRNRRARLGRRGNRARDEIGAHERPRRVVNHAPRRRRRRPPRTRWPPSPAAARPPATSRSGLAETRRYAGGSATSSAGSATTTSSIAGCSSSADTLRSSSARPATSSSCFGRSRRTAGRGHRRRRSPSSKSVGCSDGAARRFRPSGSARTAPCGARRHGD